MQKTFIVVVALFGLISASSFFRAPTTDAFAYTSRNFSITPTAAGSYLAFVDYINNADLTKPNNTFLVSLYTSQQVFSAASTTDPTKPVCKGFAAKTYDCAGDMSTVCTQDPAATEVAITTPYFVGKGKPMKTVLNAEYYSWRLQNTAPAMTTTTCESENANVNQAPYADAQGIWGLGFDGEAKKNFVNNTKNFWISFTNSTVLNIAFSDAKDITPTGSVVEKKFSVKTDGNWAVTAKGVSTYEYKGEGATKIIFDVNTKNNGFPKAIYDKILEQLATKAGCDKTVNEASVCKTKVKADDLKIEIAIDDKNKLTLTAWDIVDSYVPGTAEIENFKLNIRALGNALTGYSHITADAETANTIILGQRTLSYYTTVFNVEESTVTQYYVNWDAVLKAIWGFIKWIIIAIVGSIIVCCLCVCFCCGGTAWIVAKLGKKDKQDNYYQSSQTDPFVARK